MKFIKTEAEKPTEDNSDYVYSGEKNYEPPKIDPWIEESK